MQRTILAVLLAFAAGTTVAQVAVSAQPDPADPKAAVPARTSYESAFSDYRPYVDPGLAYGHGDSHAKKPAKKHRA